MSNIEPHPPSQTVTCEINIPVASLPEGPFAVVFAHCCAEAQMLEHAIKGAITKDVQVFAKAGEQITFLEILARTTLGQARHIAMGTSRSEKVKKIAACVGFSEFVKMQWDFSGRPQPELNRALKDVVDRRNRLAHQLVAEVLHSVISVSDALMFMKHSSERFFEIRRLVVAADELSSKMGSVATDGSSLPRFKTTS